MTQIGPRVIVLPSRMPDQGRGLVLDLLDGRHTIASIARQLQISISQIENLVDRLTRLELIGTRQKSRKRRGPQPGAANVCTQPRAEHLLIAGLDGLGLNVVVPELISAGFLNLTLFDPDPHVSVAARRALSPDLRRTVKVAGSELSEALLNIDSVVCCSDGPTLLPEFLANGCTAAGVPLVVAQVTDNGGIVGPLQPNDRLAGGCVICSALYRARQDAFAWNLREYVLGRHGSRRSWTYEAGPTLSAVLADLVLLGLLQMIGKDRQPPLSESTVWMVSGEPAKVAVRQIPKHYECVRCYPAAGGDASQLRRRIERNWRQTFGRAIQEPADLLHIWQQKHSLVDDVHGIFRTCGPDAPSDRRSLYRFFNDRGANPKASLVANTYGAVAVRPFPNGAEMTLTYSERLDFEDPRKAESLALVEGLERLFALDHCAPDRIITGRYSEWAGNTLDPREYPLYPEELYSDRRFGLRRFDTEDPIRWVWGNRVIDSKPVRVPFDLIYGTRKRGCIFVANSNGAACHSSFHHAVLAAIYETIERDALMTAWLHRLTMPRLRLCESDGNPTIRRELESLSLELTHIDITTDIGIPVVLAILRDRLNPDFFLLTMASSLNLQELLSRLHKEMVQFCRRYMMDRQHYRRAATENPDPRCVRDFPDHLAFYQSRKKQRHARFLWSGATVGWPDQIPPGVLDVCGQIDWIARRLAERGYDTIAVDCTVPFLRDLGLYAVKVLIPGLQPLQAGHRFTPVGTKLLQRARLMGLAAKDRTVRELNQWPHPFW